MNVGVKQLMEDILVNTRGPSGKVINVRDMAAFDRLNHLHSSSRGSQCQVLHQGICWVVAGVSQLMWSGNQGVKEELVFWLERLEKVSSQSIRSEPVTTGSTRVARKGNEINEKRFQCPLLDWEVVKVVPTGSSGPWRWGSIY